MLEGTDTGKTVAVRVRAKVSVSSARERKDRRRRGWGSGSEHDRPTADPHRRPAVRGRVVSADRRLRHRFVGAPRRWIGTPVRSRSRSPSAPRRRSRRCASATYAWIRGRMQATHSGDRDVEDLIPARSPQIKWACWGAGRGTRPHHIGRDRTVRSGRHSTYA